MFKINEYALTGHDVISMPYGSIVLSVKVQQETIVLFAVINKETKEMECREFFVYQTGQDIPDMLHMKFIGTAVLSEKLETVGVGNFKGKVFHKSSDVFLHVFEKISIDTITRRSYGVEITRQL
jgi:hypothetical protein